MPAGGSTVALHPTIPMNTLHHLSYLVSLVHSKCACRSASFQLTFRKSRAGFRHKLSTVYLCMHVQWGSDPECHFSTVRGWATRWVRLLVGNMTRREYDAVQHACYKEIAWNVRAKTQKSSMLERSKHVSLFAAREQESWSLDETSQVFPS